MGIEPGYGETPLEPDEADALTTRAREVFGDQPMRLDLYAAEQAIADEVSVRFFADTARGVLRLDDLLTDTFLRDLHRQLYEELWIWAGTYRVRELSIGIDPLHIAVELRAAFDALRYRWEHTDDWTPRELGIAVHAETVRIHTDSSTATGVQPDCSQTSCYSQRKIPKQWLRSTTGILTSASTLRCCVTTT